MELDELVYQDMTRFVLQDRARWPRIVALGEPLHGEDAFLELRNGLFRRLVEDERCGCVALESDCLAGRRVDDHVHRGRGDLDSVMAEGFSHGFGASAANRALVQLMSDLNQARRPADHVRFAGFDAPMEFSGAQSPRVALDLLYDFLAAECATMPHQWSRVSSLLGDDGPWTNPDVMMDPSQAIGSTDRVRELRAITNDLGWLLASREPQLATHGSTDAVRDAELALRTADGLLAYHAALARPDQHERLGAGLAIRDTMMAGNLLALTRGTDRQPVLTFAHNQHIRRGVARWQLGDMDLQWNPAGAHVDRTYGSSGYVVIATAIGSAPHLGINDPPPDTLEGLLAETEPEPRLVPTTEITTKIRQATADLTLRATDNPGYFPIAPDALADVDAILFLPHVEAPAQMTR